MSRSGPASTGAGLVITTGYPFSRDVHSTFIVTVVTYWFRLVCVLRVLPGHTVETTIGREWERNPFVRVWRGLDEEVGTPCSVGGVEGVVLVESPDYDGKGKLLVRLAGGGSGLSGASRVDLG